MTTAYHAHIDGFSGKFFSPRQIRYYDDYCELREGELIERNGSLAYIRDAETGEQGWVPTFYIEGGLRDCADRELVDRELIATKANYARSFKWGFDHFTDNPQDDWRCDAVSARAWRREMSDEDDEMSYEDILDDIGPCQCASCAGANYRAARGPNAQLPLSIRIALNLAL